MTMEKSIDKIHDAAVSQPTGAVRPRLRNDFSFMTAVEMRRLIRNKQASPVEIVESTLRHVEALQPSLNAFVTITPDLAIDAARKAEKAVLSDEKSGLLTGLPLSIKDLTAVK